MINSKEEGVRTTQGRDKKCVQKFSLKTWTEGVFWGDPRLKSEVDMKFYLYIRDRQCVNWSNLVIGFM